MTEPATESFSVGPEEGAGMDRNEAREALTSAGAMPARMRRGSRSHVALIFLLGLVMMVLTAVYGLVVEPSMEFAVPVVLLVPLLVLGIYTATRPVLPRHYRAWYAVITSAGAGVYALTVTIGTVGFSGEPAWWLPAAVLCAVPFFLIGLLDRRAGRATEGTP